jgi:2'-5' RNA ligase
VLWIGIEGYEKLSELNDLIKTGLNDTGFPVEDRPFKPHVTLGRIKHLKNAESLKSALEMYRDTFIQDVIVEELILYQSVLRPEGPIYKAIETFSLNQGRS